MSDKSMEISEKLKNLLEEMTFSWQIRDRMTEIEQLRRQLLNAGDIRERIALLDLYPTVQKLLATSNFFQTFLQSLSLESEYVLKQCAVIEQAIDPTVLSLDRWQELLKTLLSMDRFYSEIGGIIGYQAEAQRLLRKKEPQLTEGVLFHSPVFEDISQETDGVLDSIQDGLDALGCVAELYPLGGAADRLHLVDQHTGLELPAAKLEFGGRALLETLIRDLTAREWLYFRLTGRQLKTPIAIMTSQEKDNHEHVLKMCEQHQWFGRPKDLFCLFKQPLVPMVDERGNWHSTGPLKLLLKPSGHGVIWKLARDEGVFGWLKSLGYTKALVRQINNPLAGLDYGLIAFTGIGWKRNMSFGFASCCRVVKSAEGMVVLVEKENSSLTLTNIEYCDFEKFGIEDEPLGPGQLYSRFTSNTNILFADLEAVEKAVESHPFPGLLMNIKPVTFVDELGTSKQIQLARLESTMQNIADAFVEEKKKSAPLKTEKTFATYNFRHKTISVAKKALVPGKSLLETPERCFYELLFANRELLIECGFTLSPETLIEEHLEKGPSALFLYHPALGPLYSIIRQKIRAGSLSFGSELSLEIAEVDFERIAIEGSVHITAAKILGHVNADLLEYSSQVGRCILHDVSVKNAGVDWTQSAPFWKMDLRRKESLRIELKGFSEFDARGCHFVGPQHFIVEDGVRLTVRQKEGELLFHKSAIESKPLWRYSWDRGVQLYRT